jgi:WD40 repeat protein
MDKKERQLYLATVPSSAFESGNLRRYYGCLTCYPFISDKLNHPSFDVQDVINDYDYVHQSDLQNYPDYDAERTEAIKLIQETFRLSAHILEEHPDQLIPQLLGRLSYPSLLENFYIQSFLEQAKAKITPPALIPCFGSLQPPGTGLIRTFFGHSSYVTTVAVAPDGKKIISGSCDKTIKVWDIDTGRELHTLTGHSTDLKLVTITPDGKKIFSGSYDKTIKVWDIDTGRELHTLTGHSECINLLWISFDNTTLVSGSIDGQIKLWDIATRIELNTLSYYNEEPWAIIVSPDGLKVVSINRRQKSPQAIRLWDINIGAELNTFLSDSHITEVVVVTPDGTKIISGSDYNSFMHDIYFTGDKTIKIWDLAQGKELHTLYGHQARILSLAITPDSNKVISGSSDHSIKVWSIVTGTELNTFFGHSAGITSLVVTPDGTKVISGSYDMTIKLWNLEGGTELNTFSDYASSGVKTLAINHDGSKIVVVYFEAFDITIKVLDISTGRNISSFLNCINSLELVSAVTSDGTIIVYGDIKGSIKVWDIATGKNIASFSTNDGLQFSGRINDLAITPDGTKIVSASRFIDVWDISTGQCVKRMGYYESPFTSFQDEITSVTTNPDGGRVIYCRDGQKVVVIQDIFTKSICHFFCHSEDITSLVVTPDGTKVISGSQDKTIKIWDIVNKAFSSKLIPDFGKTGNDDALNTLTGHTQSVTAVMVIPNSLYLVSSSLDRTVKIWSLSTGECLHTFINDSPITAIVISPDGKKVIAGDEAGRLHFLELIV